MCRRFYYKECRWKNYGNGGNIFLFAYRVTIAATIHLLRKK